LKTVDNAPHRDRGTAMVRPLKLAGIKRSAFFSWLAAAALSGGRHALGGNRGKAMSLG